MAKETPTYTASDAKVHLGELMDECRQSGSPIVIRHHKKPYVVMLDYREWQRGQAAPPSSTPLQLEFRALRKSLDKSRETRRRPKRGDSRALLQELRSEREKKLQGSIR